MGRNSEKWRENKGIMIRISGIKIYGIRLESGENLMVKDDIEYGNIRRGHPKMPYDYWYLIGRKIVNCFWSN